MNDIIAKTKFLNKIVFLNPILYLQNVIKHQNTNYFVIRYMLSMIITSMFYI